MTGVMLRSDVQNVVCERKRKKNLCVCDMTYVFVLVGSREGLSWRGLDVMGVLGTHIAGKSIRIRD